MTHGRLAKEPLDKTPERIVYSSVTGRVSKGTANEKSNVGRFEEDCKGVVDRDRVIRCAHVDAGRGCALHRRRQFGAGFGDHQSVRQRCMEPRRHRTGKSLYSRQDRPASKGCIDKVLDKMAGQSFKVCKNQTYALCAAARCNVYDGVAYCQCDVKHGDSISLPFSMGKDEDVCSVNAAGADNKYMISTYSLPEVDCFAAGRWRGLHLLGQRLWRLRPVRRRNMLQEHRRYDVPGLRQTSAEGTNHLFLSCHSGQDRRRRARLSNPRALSLRQVLLPILQSRHRYQQDRFNDLCRRSDWHGSGFGGPAQRQGSARKRVSGVMTAVGHSRHFWSVCVLSDSLL